jgi:hypothetical protein
MKEYKRKIVNMNTHPSSCIFLLLVFLFPDKNVWGPSGLTECHVVRHINSYFSILCMYTLIYLFIYWAGAYG